MIECGPVCNTLAREKTLFSLLLRCSRKKRLGYQYQHQCCHNLLTSDARARYICSGRFTVYVLLLLRVVRKRAVHVCII